MENRKYLRLKTHDYSSPGSYFITSCVLGQQCYFGYVDKGVMIHNQYGEIAVEQFLWLSEYYSYVNVGSFCVMPNHVHAIIDIKQSPYGVKLLSLSQLVGAYKTRVSTGIHKMGLPKFAWQRSFHEHIIRNMESYQNIAGYIKENPSKWNEDRFFRNNGLT